MVYYRFNRNTLSTAALVGMIIGASFLVHGPMVIPAMAPPKKGSDFGKPGGCYYFNKPRDMCLTPNFFVEVLFVY